MKNQSNLWNIKRKKKISQTQIWDQAIESDADLYFVSCSDPPAFYAWPHFSTLTRCMRVNPSVSMPSSLGSASLACDCDCLMDLSFLFIYFGAFCAPFVFTMHWWSNRAPCQVHRALDMRNPRWWARAIVLSARMCFCLHPCSFLSQLTATQRINHTVDQPALVGTSKGYFEVESPPLNSGARKNLLPGFFFFSSNA